MTLIANLDKTINCDHDWKLNSKIRFVDKSIFICTETPIKDFEVCTKCGKVGKLIR